MIKDSRNIFATILMMLAVVATVMSCRLSVGNDDGKETRRITIERCDELEYRFLTTGDYAALQQMNTNYPTETRTLLEKVLELGMVDDHSINERFLKFYQDSTLDSVLSECYSQYRDVSDLEEGFANAFDRLEDMLPNFKQPVVYMQIGALGQSVIVGNDNTIGICLDKYLGKDYPAYRRFYSDQQREQMERKYIIPDCLVFYLISLYPLHNFELSSQLERDIHLARIQWVVNRAMNRQFFSSEFINKVEKTMSSKNAPSVEQLLSSKI